MKECHYEDTEKCEVEYKDQCEVTYAYGKQCTKVPVPNCSTVKVTLSGIVFLLFFTSNIEILRLLSGKNM